MDKAVAQLSFTSLLLLFFIYTAVAATSFKELARYFPLYLSVIGAVLLFIEVIRQLLTIKKNMKKDEQLHPNIKAVILYTLYLTGYILLVYLIGMIIATVIFLFVFLYFTAKMRLISSIITVIVVVGVLMLFADVMNLYWPKSIFNIF